jgi:hypothetical protein
MNIQINKTYDYFDDGKIKENRRMSVLITDIIPFDEIDKETLLYWGEDVEDCGFLYARKTDYFIKGNLTVADDIIKKVVFVRTVDGSWFSLGFWGGQLDVDGELLKSIEDLS